MSHHAIVTLATACTEHREEAVTLTIPLSVGWLASVSKTSLHTVTVSWSWLWLWSPGDMLHSAASGVRCPAPRPPLARAVAR